MASFIDARDQGSGNVLATLSCSTFLWRELPFEGGLVRRLREAFVAEGRLSAEQAGAAIFSVGCGLAPARPEERAERAGRP